VITKTKANRCITHHICDCQKYQFEQARNALDIIQSWAGLAADSINTVIELGGVSMPREEVVNMLRLIQKKAEEGLEKLTG